MREAVVRNADRNDLDGVLEVERCWPVEQRAGREKFASRLERFPEGFFVAECEGRIVGAITSCPVRYEPGRPEAFPSWSHATNDGFIHPPGVVRDANALYIISNGIVKEHRRSGLRERLVGAQLDLARKRGLRFALTGAMLPGYDAYCREHGELPARDYAYRTREDGAPVDPTLRKLGALGLLLPSPEHVIPDYYPSPESRDHGALLVYENPDAL